MSSAIHGRRHRLQWVVRILKMARDPNRSPTAAERRTFIRGYCRAAREIAPPEMYQPQGRWGRRKGRRGRKYLR